MRGRWVAVLGLVLLLHAAAPLARSQEERLSVEWIFSDEGKTAASVPKHAWLDTGQALLYDQHPPKAERTIESFDPTTGRRTRLVDAQKAVASLTELLRPEEPLEELGWPHALDPKGRWAVYEKTKGEQKEKDVFLLDLETSKFVAVANTDAEEKSPRFSPDGRKLAFVRASDLYLYDLETREERRLTHDGSPTLLNATVSWVYWEEVFARNDLGYWWSPDSRAIAYLQTDESGVGRVSFVDFEPNLPRVIHQRYPKTGEANPRVRAGVLDLETGTTTWVDLGTYPHEYLVRVDWTPDGKRLVVQTLDRPQTTLDLFLVDAATGKATHLLRETDPGWVNLHDDLHLLKDGRRFLWASERDGYTHLYLYDMSGKLLHQVTRGAWSVRAATDVFWQRRAVAWIDEERELVYFTALAKSSIEKQLYRIRLDGTDMQRVTAADGTHRVVFRPDGRYYLDAHSATDRLPALTLHRPDGGLLHTVSPPRPDRFQRFDLLPRELFHIAAADGFRLPAMLLKPRDFDPAKKHPVVLYVYGGPSAPTVSHAWGGRARDYFEQLLADRGFVTLRVDNRSATGASKKLENLIARDGYGTTELTDLLDAVKWLKSQPWVDPDRVGVWGWSGGGSYTLLAMTGSQEFRAGVAVAPVTDWRYYDTIWAEAFMKRPLDNPQGYDKTSHALRAEQLHGRLLLVHGTYDDNVHPQNTWRFADELIRAGILFDMMIYPMRKHDIRDDAAQKHLYATMLEFWDRNLK